MIRGVWNQFQPAAQGLSTNAEDTVFYILPQGLIFTVCRPPCPAKALHGIAGPLSRSSKALDPGTAIDQRSQSLRRPRPGSPA